MDGSQLLTLGTFEFRVDGRAVARPSTQKARALLAYLALHRNITMSREQIMDEFWPESAPDNARQSLKTALWSIRRSLREAGIDPQRVLAADNATVAWHALTRVDAGEFEERARAGDTEALQLYTGDFLPGDYDLWASAHRERLVQLLETLLERSLQRQRDSGMARWLLQLDPFNEEAHAALIDADVAAGRAAAASALLARFRERLRENGLELSAAFERRFEGLSGTPLRRSEKRRRSDEPARHGLPRYLTELIGRERDVADVVSMLDDSPLVSIVGAGGVGKTRLAVQAGEQLFEAFADGVEFVDLSTTDDPSRVPGTIAAAFGVADTGGTQPLVARVAGALKGKQLLIVLDNCEHVISAAADAANAILQACDGVRILATSREPLGITGEETYRMPPLEVPPPGVHLSPDRALEYAAIALFAARARAVKRSFALVDENVEFVADVVRRLDGIALAIELAASRVNALSLQQLAERLDERLSLLTQGSRTALPRHQTLRALIGWSYDLLGDAERSLVRRLAVFRGGWTLEAAEAICTDARFPAWNTFDLLASLVDKSLIVAEIDAREQRYRFLDSTRAFAAERLLEAGERDGVAAEHCRYYAQAALRASDAYWETDSDVWTARLRLDIENYRAAIDWGLGFGRDPVAAATIVASLRALWLSVSRREGSAALERAAAALPLDAPARVRGLLLLARAFLDRSALAELPAAQAAELLEGVDEFARVQALSIRGFALVTAARHREAAEVHHVALAAARATSAQRLIAWVLPLAAIGIGYAGDRALARALFDEAAELLATFNDPRRLAQLHLNRAEFLFDEHDLAGAVAGARVAETIYRERGDRNNLSAALLNAAGYRLASGEFEEAWCAARESLELAMQADDAYRADVAIGHLAHVAAETGDAVRAARLLGYADAAFRRLAGARHATEQRGYERACEIVRATIAEDRAAALGAQGAAMERRAAAAEALAIARPSAPR